MAGCGPFCRLALIAAALLAAAAAAHGEEPKVGVALAVNPDATGQPPEQGAQTLMVGASVLHQERIATSQSGQVQIQFLDQSSLTVAPDSELTIDEFVYDPGRGAGRFAAQLGSGIVRYVGGQISKRSEVVFRTPSATIGIRGGMALISVQAGGATQATFLFGETMRVTAGGVTQTVTESGRFVQVPRVGQPPSPPAPVTRQAIQATIHALIGHAPPAPTAPAGQPGAGAPAVLGRVVQAAATQGQAATALLKQFIAASPSPNIPPVSGLSTTDQTALRRAAILNNPVALGYATELVVQRNPNLVPAVATAVSGRLPAATLASIVAPVALKLVPPEVLAAALSGSPQSQTILRQYLQGQGLTPQAIVQRAEIIAYAVRGTSAGSDPQALLAIVTRVADDAKALVSTPDAKLSVEAAVFAAAISVTAPPGAGSLINQPIQPGQSGQGGEQPLDVIQPPNVPGASPT
jgi:hypothetical protein